MKVIQFCFVVNDIEQPFRANAESALTIEIQSLVVVVVRVCVCVCRSYCCPMEWGPPSLAELDDPYL
ncbi:hypothetical protein BLOT_000149 [Blomia tropicalis]|nr:hypothetical protein BLOT_000149 [Blomia tropicalis]